LRLIQCAYGYPRHHLLVLLILLTLSSSACMSSPMSRANQASTSEVAAEVTVRVDGAQRFQTIDGFGVNINGMVWDGGKVVPTLKALSDGMGATLFRVIIDEADWEQRNDNADPRSFNWSYYNQIYSSGKFASLWATLRYFEQKPGARVILNVMGRLPDWMGRTTLNPQSEDEFVEMLASLFVYGRKEQGLQLKLFSPLNEIDIGDPEGPSVSAEQYAQLMHKLAVRLDELGLDDVGLVAPDTAKPGLVPSYLGSLLDDEVVARKLALVAFHTYGGTIDEIPPAIAASPRPELAFWVTEYSRWCEGCLTAPAESEQWTLATDTTDYLFNYLREGAAGALLWEGFDSYYNHHGAFQYWGILAYNPQTGSFTPRHRYHTAVQIFRYVRPGMARIAAESSDPNLQVLAFQDTRTGALAIVGRNPASRAIKVTLALTNLTAPQSLHLSYTTEKQAGASGGEFAPSGGSFTVDLPADSVFALTPPRQGLATTVFLPSVVRSAQ
jgi:O-glycosyl hydrolase